MRPPSPTALPPTRATSSSLQSRKSTTRVGSASLHSTSRLTGPRNVVLRRYSNVWPPARRRPGSRLVSSSSTVCISSRASEAPRQKWIPWPNERWLRAFSRPRSTRSGSAKTLSSRLAEPSRSRMLAPSGRSVSPTRVAAVVTRFQVNTAGPSRSISSTAAGIREGSSHSCCQRSRCSSSSLRPDPRSDVVVS